MMTIHSTPGTMHTRQPELHANVAERLGLNVGRTIGDHGADEAARGVSATGAWNVYPTAGLPVSGDELARRAPRRPAGVLWPLARIVIDSMHGRIRGDVLILKHTLSQYPRGTEFRVLAVKVGGAFPVYTVNPVGQHGIAHDLSADYFENN